MARRENEEVEFKKTTSELREGVISLSSMLNKSNHGVVYFGIKNDGSVFGLDVGINTTTNIVNELKHHIKPFVSPKIEVLDEEGKKIIRVEAYGNEAPYSAYGRYYRRCDDQDLAMTAAELEHAFQSKNYTYSDWEQSLTEYGEEDIDEERLIRYIDEANESGRMDYRYNSVSDAMVRLGLMKAGYLNNAGLYLFSKRKPITVKLARFASDERTLFIDNRIISGNIFECIEQTIQYIISALNVNAVIKDMKRVEQLEIPVEAIREIVVNSFVHMKVIEGDYNEVTITPSYVRIYNPGAIAMNEDPETFASGTIGSKLRNPLIAMTLYRNKTIEAFGTGFKRVFTLCDSIGVGYSYRTEMLGFAFIFKRGNTRMLDEALAAEKDLLGNNVKYDYVLSDSDKAVYELIRKKGVISSIPKIAEETGKAPITVQRALASLVEKHLIERIGSKKAGYWKSV